MGFQEERRDELEYVIMMKTLAIIGFGRFGQLMAGVLREHFEVCAYNPRDKSRIAAKLGIGYESSLEKATQKDIVVLSMPISALEDVLQKIAPHLKQRALVLDVCSVKQAPAELMSRLLPEHVDIIRTHPLFGPDSSKVCDKGGYDISGRKVAVCPVRTKKWNVDKVCKFLRKLGLVTYVVTPEEHDRQMAVAQGLTHYIALGLMKMNVGRQKLTTPNFDMLLEIVSRLESDTDVLLRDIQVMNPYAEDQREKFRKMLDEIEKKIGGN